MQAYDNFDGPKEETGILHRQKGQGGSQAHQGHLSGAPLSRARRSSRPIPAIHSFEKVQKVNTYALVNRRAEEPCKTLDWRSDQGKVLSCHQGFALSHAFKKTQAWIFVNVFHQWSPDVWSPNSPELNPPIIFYFAAYWGARPTPSSTPTSTPSKPPLWSSWPSWSDRSITRAYRAFRTRMGKLLKVESGHIKK